MKTRFRTRVLPLLGILVITLSQMHCLLVPSDTETGARVGNLPPTVRITAGAASPDPRGVDYKVQFQWSGSDADGVVDRYRWAVDDTLSQEAWHDTTGFSATFKFFATTPRPDNPTTLSDWHTFYIRAIDNEFAISLPEKRYFNATTVAPSSTIKEPKLTGSFTQLQRTFNITWEGEDLDSSRPDRKPIYYEFKLVHVPDFGDINLYRQLVYSENNILMDTLRVGDKTRWIRVPETTRTVELRELQPSGGDVASYAFAVRSVDEAGAVEPILDRGRNLIIFSVTASSSKPRVTISEPTLGSATFPRFNNVWDNVTVFAGKPYRFHWTGDAAYYGSTPGDVNYGLDIPDPEDESLQDIHGIGGWIGWGKWEGNQDPYIFTKDQVGTVHYLYVYMRDVSNSVESTQKCVVRLNVVDFTFSRYALLVDDAALQYVNDADHDLYLNSTVFRQLYAYGHVDQWSAFGDGDVKHDPRKLPDDIIVFYQNIVWNLGYFTRPGSGINATEITGNRGLSSFLAAGGRLFICGGPVLAACERTSTFYPHEPPVPEGGSDADITMRERFWYNLLYMRNTIYAYYDLQSGRICNPEAGGLVEAKSANPNYPDLLINTSKWNPDSLISGRFRSGIKEWDGFKLASQHDYKVSLPGLDTLYTAVTYNKGHSQCAQAVGTGNNSVIGWRYVSTRADTLARRQHGRVIVFDFQPWYFTRARLTDAGTSAINWLVTGRDH